VYCSVPTSPGGLYRTPLGRLIFKTDEMVLVVEAPDIVRNKVSFSVFGLEGSVSLKGKLTVFCHLILFEVAHNDPVGSNHFLGLTMPFLC
jgi:hypothetical protein